MFYPSANFYQFSCPTSLYFRKPGWKTCWFPRISRIGRVDMKTLYPKIGWHGGMTFSFDWYNSHRHVPLTCDCKSRHCIRILNTIALPAVKPPTTNSLHHHMSAVTCPMPIDTVWYDIGCRGQGGLGGRAHQHATLIQQDVVHIHDAVIGTAVRYCCQRDRTRRPNNIPYSCVFVDDLDQNRSYA